MNPRRCLHLFFAAALFFVFTFPAYAMSIRSGERVVVAENETIQGSLFTAGSQVTIEGTVEGDLFCAGQDVDIKGIVRGDIICAGQSLRFFGQVEGDIRSAGQMITLKNRIGHNASLLGQTIYIEPQASIAGELGFVSQTFRQEGRVEKSLYGSAEKIIISGKVGKDATLFADSLSIDDAATIAGNVTYTSSTKARIVDNSSIQGAVEQKQPVQKVKNRRNNMGSLYSLVFSFIFGGVLLFFFKKQTQAVVQTMKSQISQTVMRSLFLLFLVPMVFFGLCLTLIGIPFAIAGLLLLLFLSYAYGSMFVGSILVERFWEAKKNSFTTHFIVGTFVCWALSHLPVVGFLFSVSILFLGAGGCTWLVAKEQNKKRS